MVGHCPCNHPDLVLWHKGDNSAFLFEANIPSDGNLHSKYLEKLAKTHKLSIQINWLIISQLLFNTISGLVSSEVTSVVKKLCKRQGYRNYCNEEDAEGSSSEFMQDYKMHSVK